MKLKRILIAALLSGAAVTFAPIKAAAQTSGPLFNEIAHLDSLQFGAFNARNLDGLMLYFDSSLELYQDNTGVRNYEQTKQAFGGLFKMDYVLTRKLIPGTMEVYPIKDFGAIETGQHTFSHVENGQLQSGTYKFMQIWQKKDGVWKVTREITYGH
jgi:ketosteroid isomerase-like protein